MKKSLSTFLNIPQKENLLARLISAGYAFAAWKMPDSSARQFIISLNPPLLLEDFKFSELDTGFIVNSFANNHPVKPTYIKADITIKGEEAKVDPSVNDCDLERFQNELYKKDQSNQQHFFREAGIDHQPSFLGSAKNAIKDIKAGHLEKVVISRYMDEPLPSEFSVWNYFDKLCENYPSAFCSLLFIPRDGVWVGASPELLLSDNQHRFQTVALAGTKPLDQNQSLNEIAWTQKEIEEQALVSRYIINCFKKIRLREFHEQGPKTVKAGSLAHLKTIFEVNYKEVNFDDLADQMLQLLHPTSAVCGMPIETAKPWINAYEAYDRALYAGFLGPVNYEESSNLFVNLRCARLQGDTIRYFAGAGITEDSIPEKELEETKLKMDILKKLVHK